MLGASRAELCPSPSQSSHSLIPKARVAASAREAIPLSARARLRCAPPPVPLARHYCGECQWDLCVVARRGCAPLDSAPSGVTRV